jgi:hypothetical protein
MMDRFLPIRPILVAIVLAAFASSCATSQKDRASLEAEVLNSRIWPMEASRFVKAGETSRRCIQTSDTVFVVNDENSIIFMDDGQFYYNRLQRPCNDVLISGFTQAITFNRNQICSGTAITLADKFGGFANAQCHLGEFQPIELVDDSAIGKATGVDTIVLNEGQVRRRPR